MIFFGIFFCLVVVWFFVASLANATYPLFVVLSEAFETVFQSMDSDQDRGIDEGEFVAYFGVQSAPAEPLRTGTGAPRWARALVLEQESPPQSLAAAPGIAGATRRAPLTPPSANTTNTANTVTTAKTAQNTHTVATHQYKYSLSPLEERRASTKPFRPHQAPDLAIIAVPRGEVLQTPHIRVCW